MKSTFTILSLIYKKISAMIRKATLKDLPYIMEIIQEAKLTLKAMGTLQWNTSDGYPTIDVIKRDIEQQHLFVYEEKNILGVMTCIKGLEPSYQAIEGSWLTSSRDYLTIHRLAVKRSHYRTSIATKLFTYAKALAKNGDCTSIRIDTHPNNLPMQSLLEKQKFIYCGKIFLPQKEDALRLAYEFKI